MTTMSDSYFQDGAAESCANFEAPQAFTPECGENRPVEAESEFPATPAPKQYADIRKALVEGIRNGNKPRRLKRAAETWVGNIDEILKAGKDPANELAFRDARVRFEWTASGAPKPGLADYTEMAKSFGLKPHQGTV